MQHTRLCKVSCLSLLFAPRFEILGLDFERSWPCPALGRAVGPFLSCPQADMYLFVVAASAATTTLRTSPPPPTLATCTYRGVAQHCAGKKGWGRRGGL